MTSEDFKAKELDEFVKKYKKGTIKLFCLFEIDDNNMMRMLAHASDEAVNKDFYLLYFALTDHIKNLESQIIKAIKFSKVEAGDLAH